MRKGSTSFGACEVRCWHRLFGQKHPVSLGGVVGTTEVVLSLNPLTGKVAARFAGISDCHAILHSGLGFRV